MSLKVDRQFLIKTIPFLFIGYFCDKIGEAYRIAEGADMGSKLMDTLNTFNTVYNNPLIKSVTSRR